jgi:hypothetical protein
MKKIALLLLVFLIISSILFVSLNYVVHSVEHKKRVEKKEIVQTLKMLKMSSILIQLIIIRKTLV